MLPQSLRIDELNFPQSHPSIIPLSSLLPTHRASWLLPRGGDQRWTLRDRVEWGRGSDPSGQGGEPGCLVCTRATRSGGMPLSSGPSSSAVQGLSSGSRADGKWLKRQRLLGFKMDKQQGPTVQQRELCSMLCGSLDGRGV